MKNISIATFIMIILISFLKSNHHEPATVATQSPINIETAKIQPANNVLVEFYPFDFDLYQLAKTTDETKKAVAPRRITGDFNENFAFVHDNDEPVTGAHYEFILESGEHITGITDEGGETAILQASSAKPFLFKFDNSKTTALKQSKFKVLANEHEIELLPTDNTKFYANFNHKFYTLQNIHLHDTSEHSIDGQFYPLEMHCVFKSDDGKLAVVAFFFTPDDTHDAGLKNINAFGLLLNSILKKENEEVNFNFAAALNNNYNFYHYTGSLTTKPFTEGVQWFVYQTILPVDGKIINQIQQLLINNNRPLQPLNGRVVNILGH